jgi:hypothetical protein
VNRELHLEDYGFIVLRGIISPSKGALIRALVNGGAEDPPHPPGSKPAESEETRRDILVGKRMCGEKHATSSFRRSIWTPNVAFSFFNS